MPYIKCEYPVLQKNGRSVAPISGKVAGMFYDETRLKIPGCKNSFSNIKIEAQPDFVRSLVVHFKFVEPYIVRVANAKVLGNIYFGNEGYRFFGAVRSA